MAKPELGRPDEMAFKADIGYAPTTAGIGKAIHASFGGTEQTKPAEYRKRSAELHPEAFTMPLAFTSGGKDTVVPPESVLRLAEFIREHNQNVLSKSQGPGPKKHQICRQQPLTSACLRAILSSTLV